MNDLLGFDKCLAFINCQLDPAEKPGVPPTPRLAITLSRQTGSGAHTVASHLAPLMERNYPGASPWAVFDRDLVEKVLRDHHLPTRLAQYMPEDRTYSIQDMMQELLGLHPPSWDLVHQTTETVLRLAELGNVILVGRGANVITARLKHVFHVRLVGSPELRLERLQKTLHLDAEAARQLMEKNDAGRRRYLKEYFGAEIDDPLLYHLTINTDRIDEAEAARLIVTAVQAAR
jgi:cytidylate kinase